MTEGGSKRRVIDFSLEVSGITHFPKYFQSLAGSNREKLVSRT